MSQLTLWECATIASITKNPTNYNPYTNPENLIHRRNFIMYNMWQQGIISEEDYRNGAAQPLVLAEEDTNKKTSSVTSYFTDALFTEVVRDIMDKEAWTNPRPSPCSTPAAIPSSHRQPQDADGHGEPDAQRGRRLLPGRLA